MLDRALIARLDMKSPAVWLATWGGCGLLKPAPGTWGTLGALPFAAAALYAGGPVLLALLALIIAAAGFRAAAAFETMCGEHDSGAIVVDEAAGICIAMLAAPASLPGAALAFVLFRFFDIVKPWPVSYCDRMPGAAGVMLDDVMAGLYAALCLGGARYAGLV